MRCRCEVTIIVVGYAGRIHPQHRNDTGGTLYMNSSSRNLAKYRFMANKTIYQDGNLGFQRSNIKLAQESCTMVLEKLLTCKMWIDSDAFIRPEPIRIFKCQKKSFQRNPLICKVDPSYRNKEEQDNIVLKITKYIIKLTKIFHDGSERRPLNLFLFKMTLINIIMSPPSLLPPPQPMEETRGEY